MFSDLIDSRTRCLAILAFSISWPTSLSVGFLCAGPVSARRVSLGQ